MDIDETEHRRPLGLILLTGLYLFFFLVSASTFGNPFPFLGRIYQGTPAKLLVLGDSIVCLYLLLGIMKRQILTWYSLIVYNLFEIANSMINLYFISLTELEHILGERVSGEDLFRNNIAMALGILLLTQFIYRHKHYFTSRQKYIF